MVKAAEMGPEPELPRGKEQHGIMVIKKTGLGAGSSSSEWTGGIGAVLLAAFSHFQRNDRAKPYDPSLWPKAQ